MRSRRSQRRDDAVLVIGLGRFGGALAERLERMGTEVLAVDESQELVQEWSGKLTHVVQVDATNADALRQIGAHEFDIAVVAIGTVIEASVLTTSVLVDIGIREVWAKAISAPHGRILERLGASHVVYPERDAGLRIARLLKGELIDFIELEEGFAMAKVRAPKWCAGKSLNGPEIRDQYGVSVVGIKPSGGAFTAEDAVIATGDVIIISGSTKSVEDFGAKAN